MLKLFTKVDIALSTFIKYLMAVFFAVASVLYIFQVLSRLFFSAAFFWIDPLVQYFFIMASFFGAAYACRGDENIKIELLRNQIKRPYFARIRYFFSGAVTLFVFLIFTFHFREEYLWSFGGEVGVSAFFGKFWLDVPYLALFLSSGFYYVLRFFNPKIED